MPLLTLWLQAVLVEMNVLAVEAYLNYLLESKLFRREPIETLLVCASQRGRPSLLTKACPMKHIAIALE